MKKIILAAAILMIAFTTNAFAAEESVPANVIRSFKYTFYGASDVSYSEVNDMIRVAFILEGKKNVAYYHANGELVVLTQAMKISEFPQSLQNDLQQRCSEYVVTDSYKFEKDGSVEYYLILDNSEKHVILHSSGKKWKTFQITKK
jgi:hypothetical protein